MHLQPRKARAKDWRRTPRLDVHGDDGLGGRLDDALLLLAVLSQALLSDPDGLRVLLLVVTTEEIDIVVILVRGSGVYGNLAGLGAVCGVVLGRIAGETGELGLVRGDVLVPARGMGVLRSVRRSLESLEDGYIGLRGRIAVEMLLADGLVVTSLQTRARRSPGA